MASLVRSNEVAGLVLNQVGDSLPEEARQASKLLKKVDVNNDGNLIMIKVKDPDPELAAEIANVWANSFETYINKLFNEQKGHLMVQVRSQLEDVEFQYKQSQTDLELFLASNQITILNRSIVNLNQKLDNQYDLLSAKYEELNLLEALLEDVYAVQDQIAPGTTSYGAKLGDMMAMANLRNNSSSLAMRTRTVQNGASSAIGHGSRIDLQINGLPVDVTEVATLEETTGLVNAIETRQARVEAEIEELSAALLEPDSQLAITVSVNDSQQPIHDLIERIQILQSRVEAQNTEARELQEARDQAWENYKSMQRKLAEVQLGSQITDSVVRTADFAVAPLKPASPRLLLNVLIGGVLGGILAVLAIFGEAYWQKPTET
jgi:uncharacterized protein involved in exopolysaccharide biosynthesis